MTLAHDVHGSMAVDSSKRCYFNNPRVEILYSISVLIPTQVILVNSLANLFTSYGNSWTKRP